MPQLPTESSTDITDGIVLSVFHRELEKNYGPVPQLPTESQTAISDGHHRWNSSVGILQRVGKNYGPVPPLPTELPLNFTDGIFRR